MKSCFILVGRESENLVKPCHIGRVFLSNKKLYGSRLRVQDLCCPLTSNQ